MELELLEKYLNEFYEIRGDTVAHIYLERFITMVSKDNVDVRELEQYLKLNNKTIWRGIKKTTKKRYSVVLNQFVRYITAVEGITVYKRNPRTKKVKISKVVSTHKNSIKIHDTFHDFVKSNQ